MSEGYDGLPPYYTKSSDPLTLNLGLSLKGIDPVVAENFVLIDDFAGQPQSSVEINGSSVQNPNFNNTTPAAPGSDINVTWQVDVNGNVSAYVPASAVPVTSVFGRTGAVVASSGDYSVGQVTGAAPAASPTFSGTVTLPATVTATGLVITDSTGSQWGAPTGGAKGAGTINAIGLYVGGAAVLTANAVSSVFGRTGAVTATSGDYSVGQVTGAAPLASPTFTGIVTLPLATAGLVTTTAAGVINSEANLTLGQLPTAVTWPSSGTVATQGWVAAQGFLTSLTIPTAGFTEPTPAYSAFAECPSTITPALYIQDVAGNWHAQAGIDTGTPNLGFGVSPTYPVSGTLTFNRQVYFRDTFAPAQSSKNAFVSINHSTGVNLTQISNQDRAMMVQSSNYTASITSITIASGVITLGISNVGAQFGGASKTFVPGQIVTPAGLTSTPGLLLNSVYFQVQNGGSSSSAILVPYPFDLTSAANAAGGNTVYSGVYLNTGLTGKTVVISGFTHAANNGTFVVQSSTANSITVNNASGVAETISSGYAQALPSYSNVSLTSDSGTLDQWVYGMEGIQCEVDVYGTPTITGSPDSEITAFSGQINFSCSGALPNPPNYGVTGSRLTVFRNSSGYISGTSIGFFGLTAGVVNNYPATLDGCGMAAGNFSFGDYYGVPSGIGYGILIGGGPRFTQSNYGLKILGFGPTEGCSYQITGVTANSPSSGYATYAGTFAANTNLEGSQFTISGCANAANNGIVTAHYASGAASTATTLIVYNPSAVTEVCTAHAQALNDYALYITGGQEYHGGSAYHGGNVQLNAGLIDGSSSLGTSGQILSSTGTGIAWETLSITIGMLPTSGTWNFSGIFGSTPTFENNVTFENPTAASSTSSTPTLKAQVTQSGGGTTSGINTTGATLLVVALAGYQGTPTISDNKGNSWTYKTASGGTYEVQFAYCLSPNVGTGHTFTLTGSGIYPACQVYAFSGVSAFDTSNQTAGGSGSPAYTGSITPSQTGDLIIVVAAGNATSGTVGITATTPSGFAPINPSDGALQVSGTAVGIGTTYEVYNSTSALNPYVTWGVGSTQSGLAIIAFKSGTTIVNTSSYTLSLEGQYWNGSASAADIWSIQDILGAGSNPPSTLTIGHSGASGLALVSMPGIILTQSSSPTSTGTAGTAGQLAWDGTNLYMCTVSGAAGSATWKKVAWSSD